MALFGTLQKGSRGDGVRKLQTGLTSAGYDVGSTGVDGIYGSATEKAVRNYQKDRGLQVDGIAGAETLGSLYKEQTSEENNPAEDRYQQALEELETLKGEKPKYAGSYESRLEELYDQIINRKPFSYDREQDMGYRQAREQYQRQGQLAMLDTLGQAAGLTGGYSNSYAQTAGQQAYQNYLEKLGQLESNRYAQAQDAYHRQGQTLLDRYSMLENLSQREYDRYRDALSQYNLELSQGRNQEKDAYDSWQDTMDEDYLLAVQKYFFG